MIKTAIFDLDGTLCDTISDLADSVNYALEQMGCEKRSLADIKSFVGNGIHNLITLSLPKEKRSEQDINTAKKFFFEYYKVHFADKTVAFDGIIQMLLALKQKGIQLAVCSNKEDSMAAAVVKKLFGDTFDIVLGQSDSFPLKPEPESTLHIIEKLGSKQEHTAFIGDSDVDIITAKNAGVYSIGVTWGFRSKKELIENGCTAIAESPWDIVKIIDNQNIC
ncbi:MAG: HAD-IA family hydrolase [Clostridia bacterium]|nr:HAD-IA family hydrolase [Clostridia bacterium]